MSGGGPHRLRCGHKNGVARAVAQSVIDHFEMIKVDMQQWRLPSIFLAYLQSARGTKFS